MLHRLANGVCEHLGFSWCTTYIVCAYAAQLQATQHADGNRNGGCTHCYPCNKSVVVRCILAKCMSVARATYISEGRDTPSVRGHGRHGNRSRGYWCHRPKTRQTFFVIREIYSHSIHGWCGYENGLELTSGTCAAGQVNNIQTRWLAIVSCANFFDES